MVKRSSSKRAYKKRGTVRKSRVIRRRKTTQSKRKTLRGGMKLSLGELRDTTKGLFVKGVGYASDKISDAGSRLGSKFSSSDRGESASLESQNVPSAGLYEQPSSPVPPQQTDEERKAALTAARTIARNAWTEAQNNSSKATKAAKEAEAELKKSSIPTGDAASSVHKTYQALVQKKKDTEEAAAAASEASRTAGETAAAAEKAAVEGGVI